MKGSSQIALAATFVLLAAGLALGQVRVLTGPIGHNGHHYYLLDTSTWTAARTTARNMGGRLAAINDQMEQQWVYQTFNAYDRVVRLYWIGLTDVIDEGQFHWTTDEALTYTNWAPGEPNNAGGNEDYVAMYYQGHSQGGRWNDWRDRTHDPIGISFSGVVEVDPGPQHFAGTGHYYEYVPSVGITWSAATAAAESRTLFGVRGHLATITSQEETDFVATAFGAYPWLGAWLGGWQEPGNPPDQGWQWVTGEAWSYTNWIAGEPNDTGGDERFLIMAGSGTPAATHWQWNDDAEATDPEQNSGYLVEYPVPEPVTLALLGVGAMALIPRRRRRAGRARRLAPCPAGWAFLLTAVVALAGANATLAGAELLVSDTNYISLVGHGEGAGR